MTPEGIHINLVTIVDSNTPEPSFRTNMVKGDQPAVLLSREWSTLVKPVAVQHDFHSNSSKDGQNMTHIYAEVYGLQNPALFKMKVLLLLLLLLLLFFFFYSALLLLLLLLLFFFSSSSSSSLLTGKNSEGHRIDEVSAFVTFLRPYR